MSEQPMGSRGRMEPRGQVTGIVNTDEALVSIAISLKRIADVLDGSAMGLCVSETIFNPATVQNRDVRNNY